MKKVQILLIVLVSSQFTWADSLSSSSIGLVKVANQNISNVVAVAIGNEHKLALKRDDSVIGWGFDYYKQTSALIVLKQIVAIAAGNNFSLALKKDGTVFGAGFNADGEATGVRNRQEPFASIGLVTIAGQVLTNVVAIAAGEGQSLALKRDGSVIGWGSSRVPANLSNVTAISAGITPEANDLALKDDGSVVEWTRSGERLPTPVGLSSNTIAIAAGGYHNLALKKDGTVVAWGRNDYGQTTVPVGLSIIVAIAAGGNYSLALKKDGTVVAWGSCLQTDLPKDLSNVVAIAAGWDCALALKNDGTVIEWKVKRGTLRLSALPAVEDCFSSNL